MRCQQGDPKTTLIFLWNLFDHSVYPHNNGTHEIFMDASLEPRWHYVDKAKLHFRLSGSAFLSLLDGFFRDRLLRKCNKIHRKSKCGIFTFLIIDIVCYHTEKIYTELRKSGAL